MLLLGIGAGLSFPSLMTLAMAGVGPSESGLASGLVNTTQQVGGALGLAVLATLSADRAESLRANGDSTAQALTGGYHLAFAIAAGLVVAGLVATLALLRTDGRAEQAEQAGEPAYAEEAAQPAARSAASRG